MNSRRGFLQSLIAAGVTAAVDPEKLLWEPGRKLISIPKPQSIVTMSRPLFMSDPCFQEYLSDMNARYRAIFAEIFNSLPVFIHGPEDFQAAARIARGSSHRGIE